MCSLTCHAPPLGRATSMQSPSLPVHTIPESSSSSWARGTRSDPIRPIPGAGTLARSAAMATTRPLLLCAALLLAALSSTFAADAPFLVAHKKVALSRPKPGVERLAVSLDLYNQGSATAYDVVINDDSWPKEAFELVSGEVSKTLERLEPGATASHAFVLESKTQGRFQASPAVIKYRVATKAALQEAYSTPILPLDILAERPPVKKFEWAKKLVAKYGALVSVVSFVLGFIYLVASPSKSAGSKSGKKRR